MSAFLQFLLLLGSSLSSAFQVETYSRDPDRQDLEIGEKMTLICISDSHWERCDWKHKTSAGGEGSHCNMEWKFNSGDVILTDCPISDRIRKVGDYNQNECGIEITAVQQEDAGTWECEMEEYKLGDLYFGTRHSHQFDPISVMMTSSDPPITTTVVIPTTEQKEEQGEEQTEDEQSEEQDDEENIEDNHKTNEGDEQKDEDSENETDYSKANETQWDVSDSLSLTDQHNTTGHPASNQLVREETVSVGPIVGGVIAVIALVTGLVAGALMWTKKKRFVTVVAMSKLKEAEDRSQANAILEEAEYNTTMPC